MNIYNPALFLRFTQKTATFILTSYYGGTSSVFCLTLLQQKQYLNSYMCKKVIIMHCFADLLEKRLHL